MIDKLIIGTVQFGLDYGITNQTGKVSEKDLDKIFNFCYENNINYFDTAQDYCFSESIISKYSILFDCLLCVFDILTWTDSFLNQIHYQYNEKQQYF